MEIREVKEQDLQPLAELFVSVFEQEPWNEDWKVAWAYERLSLIFKSHRFYGYMAIENQTILGGLFSRLGSYRGRLELEIVEYYVSSGHQRKGLGSALLKQLKSTAQIDGITCFVLQTDKDTYAKDFYIKHGFEAHENNLLMSLAV